MNAVPDISSIYSRFYELFYLSVAVFRKLVGILRSSISATCTKSSTENLLKPRQWHCRYYLSVIPALMRSAVTKIRILLSTLHTRAQYMPRTYTSVHLCIDCSSTTKDFRPQRFSHRTPLRQTVSESKHSIRLWLKLRLIDTVPSKFYESSKDWQNVLQVQYPWTQNINETTVTASCRQWPFKWTFFETSEFGQFHIILPLSTEKLENAYLFQSPEAEELH